MANNKKLDVRIMQKADTYENFLATDLVYLKNELLFAYKENDNVDFYLADGVHKFSELKPVFSSTWVFGRNEISLNPIQLLATDWVNNTQTKPVSGVLQNEAEQLIVPAWAGQSKEIALSCGIDFIVRQDGALDFICNVTPTQDVVVYIGILGKLSENEDDNGAYIKTDIDTTLSSSSTNPVENRVITNKISDIEATLRGITGDETGSDNTSLPAISNTLNNTTTYSNVPTKVGTLTTDGGTTKEEIDRVVISFNVTVNRANLNPDSDISCFAINNTETINMDKLTNAWWTGKASTGEFFGSCPIIIDNTGKINLVSVPVIETEYTLNGFVTVEYT